MKKIHKRKRSARGAWKKKQGKKVPITKLPRLEMYAVLGLELNKTMIEKIDEVKESVEILARQKSRELNPDEPIEDMSE